LKIGDDVEKNKLSLKKMTFHHFQFMLSNVWVKQKRHSPVGRAFFVLDGIND
jgi:hypothetical protein